MSRRREASFTSSTPRPASHAAVEMLLCRHTARHTQQDSSHLRGLQLCTRLLVVTGFSTRACDPEDLLSSLNGGARGTTADTGPENLLTPETAWGVRAADLSKLGTDMTPPEGSSASPACGECPPVQLEMPLQLRLLLSPVTAWDHPSCWKELSECAYGINWMLCLGVRLQLGLCVF